MSRMRNQPGERRSINPKDQFGRKWAMSVELATGDPTGAVLPAWGAIGDPLCTPMTHIHMVRNEDRQVELGLCRVDFEKWIQEIEASEKVWYDRLIDNALLKNVDITDIEELKRHKIILGLTGPKPWPSAEVLRQAQAGDRKLLGIEPLTAKERLMLGKQTLDDLKATPREAKSAEPDMLPPDNYQDFVKWSFARGTRDLKEVASLWKVHREQLAAA